MVRHALISQGNQRGLHLSAAQIFIFTLQIHFRDIIPGYYFNWQFWCLFTRKVSHGDRPLFRFAMSPIPRVTVQCTAGNIEFLFTILKENAGNISRRLTDKRSHQTKTFITCRNFTISSSQRALTRGQSLDKIMSLYISSVCLQRRCFANSTTADHAEWRGMVRFPRYF